MSKAENIKDLMRWFTYPDISPKEGDRALVIIEKEDSAFTAIFTAGPDGFPWVDGAITYWMPLPPEITTGVVPNVQGVIKVLSRCGVSSFDDICSASPSMLAKIASVIKEYAETSEAIAIGLQQIEDGKSVSLEELSAHVEEKIAELKQPNDTDRLDWLEKNKLQFDRVREYVEEGWHVRDAIDDAMSGKDVDDEEAK